MIKKYLRILSPTIVCCCLFITTASARVCFLPDSKDCGQSEITNVVVTCESQGGYDNENACTANKKPSLTCYQNNECYFRKCQYDSELECKNEVHTNKYNCKSEKIDEQTTCYYSTVKTCAEINAEYKDSYNKETQVVEDTIQDANGNNCYKTRTKYCSEINANYRVSCPSLGGKETGVFGKDGACLLCYTCADKGYTEIGVKNINCWDCEICPIGLTYKCSVKKDLATSDYKIDSSISSILGTNAQRCLKKSCADKFLKTEKSCASENRAFISSTPEVKASDGVCGTCTLKTCKQQDLVAEADCDTTANTFTENKSVTASDAPCGTCTTKNTPKYDTYTIYAKVKCAGPYEQITQCASTPTFWGGSNNDDVCPIRALQGSGGYTLGQLYDHGYATEPFGCASFDIISKDSISANVDQFIVDFTNSKENNILKNLGISKESLADDEQLIKFIIKNAKNYISGLELSIKPRNEGTHEVYNFYNYIDLSDTRRSDFDYEYAFADKQKYISDLTYKKIDLTLDEKQNQYIGSLPTIYPVIRLKAALSEEKKSDFSYTENKVTHTYQTVVFPPYYKNITTVTNKDADFFSVSSSHWNTTTGYNTCDHAYFSFVGASRNVLSKIYTAYDDDRLVGAINMDKGDVFKYADYFPSCNTKNIYNIYGTDPTGHQYYDLINNYMKKHKDKNDRALPNGFSSGYVHSDGAIYIFEDGFNTKLEYNQLPESECSTKTCSDFGSYFDENDKASSEERKKDYESGNDSDSPTFADFKQITTPCQNLKCYTAKLYKCDNIILSIDDFKKVEIPVEEESDMQVEKINDSETPTDACLRLKVSQSSLNLNKAVEISTISGQKCAVCYFDLD